jgi:hypothetical protein
MDYIVYDSVYDRIRRATGSLCMKKVITQNYLQAHLILRNRSIHQHSYTAHLQYLYSQQTIINTPMLFITKI